MVGAGLEDDKSITVGILKVILFGTMHLGRKRWMDGRTDDYSILVAVYNIHRISGLQ